jgi:ribosomal protein S18 acetylase RimI-like enzyme
MYVMPEHAGRGLGSRLLDACVEVARAEPSVEVLYLTVTGTNSGAIRLYERTGFVAYGLEPRSMRVGDRTFDKLMMALHLRPA